MKSHSPKIFINFSFAFILSIVPANTNRIFWVARRPSDQNSFNDDNREESDELIGCISVTISADLLSAEISHLCVLAAFRRMHVAKAMTETALAYCRANGVQLVHLTVVEDLMAAR